MTYVDIALRFLGTILKGVAFFLFGGLILLALAVLLFGIHTPEDLNNYTSLM